MAPDALRRNVKIMLAVPGELTINVAPATAALVVANVLDNAVKFSPPGSEVSIRASIEDGAVIVSVSDSGPGVTEEEIPRLFERFYRGSAAHRTEVPGTPICRILAESQGGSVSAMSGPGGGAVVRVRLPLAA
jgi:two-component system, OmpR family, sensor kinase